jgi:hypothetical protein
MGMLVVETVGRIRRAHFVQGESIKEIVRELRVSRNTVRRVLRSGETQFTYERELQPRPKLGPWMAELDRLLAENEARPRRDRLDLMRIFEDMRSRGYGAAMTRSGAMRAPVPAIVARVAARLSSR